MLQFVVNDFDDLLARRNRFGNRLTRRLILNRFDEITSNGKGNVGLKQGNADFAQGGFDVFFGQGTLFAEFLPLFMKN